jgi:hypothetical protein
LLLAFVGFARADDIQEPTDPLAKAAFNVLSKHCARCHEVERLAAERKGRPRRKATTWSSFPPLPLHPES